jgi:CelD/BcsL family acetyltransferase involved in cellulose biosynthesis
MPDYVIRRLSSLDELDVIQGEWTGLVEGIEHPGYHHSFEWTRAALAHLLSPAYRVYTVRAEGELVGAVTLAPIELRRGGIPIRVLKSPEHPLLPLGDILIHRDHSGPELLRSLLRHLRQEEGGCDVVELTRIRERSCVSAAVSRGGLGIGRSDGGECLFFPCGEPDGVERRSAKQLRNYRRLARKAELDLGPVEFRQVSNAERMEEAVETFLEVEASGWKGADGTGTALASDERQSAFYREAMVAAAGHGAAQVDLLLIDGRPAAAHLSLRAGAVWYLLKIGHDPEFAAYGPGGILLQRVLERAAEQQGVDEVNLVTGPEWAARWHPEGEPVRTVWVYGESWKGRVLGAARRAIESVKTVRDA